MANGNTASASWDDLDALIEEARKGQWLYTVAGNALHGWWTGRSPQGQQLLAAPYGDELFLARFDNAGNLSAVERHSYPAAGRAENLPGDCIHVADLESVLRCLVPGFEASTIRVRPFRIDDIDLELHALPDRVRADCGMRAAEICQYPGEWKQLREWFEQGCCEVYFHSDGCWYDRAGALVG